MSQEVEKSPQLCSLINLIATPEKYHNQKVIVLGVARVEPELRALYFCREHVELNVQFTSVWLKLEDAETTITNPERFNGEYIVVEGVYDMNLTGHLGAHHGSIRRIARIDLWKPSFVLSEASAGKNGDP
jgi:hypothetical protein